MFKKLKENQFLFEELVKRDFKKKYKGTVLGLLWSVLSPLLQLLVMALVFTQFFGRNTPHYVVYVFCGNIVFSYYHEATRGGMNAIVSNAGIFTKVNVPKYMFLLSKNVQALISFILTIFILFIFVAVDRIPFTWRFVFLLYPIGMLVLFNIGVGMILSAWYVFFRDLQYLYEVFTRLLMYMSAVFYTVDHYSQTVQKLFHVNPVYCFIRYFRLIIINSVIPPLYLHLIILADVSIVVGFGCLIYKKKNTEFLYYV